MVMAMIILGTMIFLAAYFLSFTIAGAKTTQSYELSTKAYYLAEAGLAEAIFKLQEDPIWRAAFETMPTAEDPECVGWSISPLTRTSVLESGGSYTVSVVNLGCAKAEISSVGRLLMAKPPRARWSKPKFIKPWAMLFPNLGYSRAALAKT